MVPVESKSFTFRCLLCYSISMAVKVELSSNKLIIMVFGFVLLAVIAAGSMFLFSRSQKNNAAKSTPASEVESTAAAVAHLMVLPDEAPTLATVTDVDKLKDQDFFQNAQNGDKVLIFKNARKAILYRPLVNKIIEVGPIRLDQSSVAGAATASAQIVSPTAAAPSPSPAEEKKVTVAVYNGTKTAGLSRKTADRLSQEFSDIKIGPIGNSKSDHTKTLVVDISQKNKSLAESVAKFLKGEVGSIPKGESTPEADIMVLVGKDQ